LTSLDEKEERNAMQHFSRGILALVIISSVLVVVPLTMPPTADSAQPAKLNVTSTTFKNGGILPQSTVFNSFGCTGGNRSPQIAWSGAPAKTAAFALILHDPDAPTGTGWYHWVIFNIPPNVHELKEGAGAKDSPDLPPGAVLGLTDFGFSEYGGPCPPVGDKKHHYRFTVYALASKIDGGATTTAAAVRFLIRSSTLASGTIVGLYGR